MNSKLSLLTKAYKPSKRKAQNRKRKSKSNIRALSTPKIQTSPTPVSPILPAIHSPIPSKLSSYDSDLQRLEALMNRNESARDALLQIRTRAMELNYAFTRKRMQSLDLDPSPFKLPPLSSWP